MKIAIAQLHSRKGDIQYNLQQHLAMIKLAAENGSRLIFFPELSITSYEPKLAGSLATHLNDARFDPLQHLADSENITICAGMPTIGEGGIHISMLIFEPDSPRSLYLKNILHQDELPYFIAGTEVQTISIKGYKIGFGICYESLQQEHILQLVDRGLDIFIASVAKPENGIIKANRYFPAIAEEFKIPILMSNSLGPSDNFHSFGHSAVWNNRGSLIHQLDNKTQGILQYDTELDKVMEIIYPKG